MRRKNLIPTILTALLIAAAGRPARAAVDPLCKTVFDSMARQRSTPTHIYSTETAPSSGGKAKTMEMIYMGDKIYILMNGKWKHSPISVQQMRQQEDENIRNAKSVSCRYLRDEAAGGEAAAVYFSRAENEGVKSDVTLWISKRTGLPLKSDNNIDTGGGDKMHTTIRYEYANVQAPAGVK